jgi:hypothetical protein
MVPPAHKAVSSTPQANMPGIKVNSFTTNRKCIELHERAPYPEEDSPIDNKIVRQIPYPSGEHVP